MYFQDCVGCFAFENSNIFEDRIVEKIQRVVVFMAGSRCQHVFFGERIELVYLLRPSVIVTLVAEGIEVMACRQKTCVRRVLALCVRRLLIIKVYGH